MYLSTDAWRPPQQLATSSSWISENLRVFEGECSVESDRLKLVSPLLSLYAEALGDRGNPIAKAVLADISRDKGRIFPTTVDIKDELGVVRTQELFGHAIEKLEEMLAQDKKLRRALRRSSTRSLSSTQIEDSLRASCRSARQSRGARTRVSPGAGDDSLQGTERSESSMCKKGSSRSNETSFSNPSRSFSRSSGKEALYELSELHTGAGGVNGQWPLAE